MAQNRFQIDNDSKFAFGEFLEAFLQRHRCPWTFRRDWVLLANHLLGYRFMTVELQDCIGRYQETFHRQVDSLTREYRKALSSSLGRLTRFTFADTVLPFLQQFHLHYLIERQQSHFAAMGAMFFLIANLTLEKYHHSNSITFIDSVVDKFAAYITDRQLDWIDQFGGWDSFCSTLVDETASPCMMEEVFSEYEASCAMDIFNGKYESKKDLPTD